MKENFKEIVTTFLSIIFIVVVLSIVFGFSKSNMKVNNKYNIEQLDKNEIYTICDIRESGNRDRVHYYYFISIILKDSSNEKFYINYNVKNEKDDIYINYAKLTVGDKVKVFENKFIESE